jgi:hypothetical protein
VKFARFEKIKDGEENEDENENENGNENENENVNVDKDKGNDNDNPQTRSGVRAADVRFFLLYLLRTVL